MKAQHTNTYNVCCLYKLKKEEEKNLARNNSNVVIGIYMFRSSIKSLRYIYRKFQ